MKIGVYGVGNFGFALIKHLSSAHVSNRNVQIVGYDKNHELIDNLIKNRRHLYHHKNVRIEKNVTFTHSPEDIFTDSNIVVLAVVSNALISSLKKNKKYFTDKSIFLNTAKALHYKTGKCFSDLITSTNEFKQHKCSFAVISGGTIASDLFHHEPLGVDIASKDAATLKTLKQLFVSDNLNVYTTTDVKGVEYAGAFKNVISILAGIIHGLGFSYGSETHFITRAAYEIKQLVSQKTTIGKYVFSMDSQSWGNDLWLSCTGSTRNRAFGMLIGQGAKPRTALQQMHDKHQTVEGINTVRALQKFNISSRFPILKAVQSIVLHNANPRKTIWKLMTSNKM